MDLQDGKWRKSVIFGSVCLLLAGGAGAYYAGAAEEPPLVLQEGETQAAAPSQNPPEIKGLQQADEVQGLRNPFSLLHEREGEIAGQSPKVSRPEEKMAAVVQVPKEQGKKSSAPWKKEKNAALSLCGIVEGDGGRLALLRNGDATVTAECGESVAGWQVTAVGKTSVTLAKAGGQVRRLSLTMVQRGRNDE